MSNNEPIKVEGVKDAFKEGATPSDSDYARLIDLAAVGGEALGATKDDALTLNPGAGLEMSGGKLAVKAGQGVLVNEADGVAVDVDKTTIKVTDKNKLTISLSDKNSGLDAVGGLHVNTGAGLVAGEKGLEIALEKSSGLSTKTGKLSVAVVEKASGLEFDSDTGALKVKLNTKKKNYIEPSDDGLAISAEGVKAIKEALKEVSTGALTRAKGQTLSGFKVDETPDDEVEKEIAGALNEAYKGGRDPKQARSALELALKSFRESKKFAGSLSFSQFKNDTLLYSADGAAFSKDSLVVFSPEKLSGDKASSDSVSSWVNEVYAVVGVVDADGKPNSSGGYYTKNALMVLVGSDGTGVSDFGAGLGSWNLAEGKWVAVGDAWTNTLPPDPLYMRQGMDNLSGLKTVAPGLKLDERCFEPEHPEMASFFKEVLAETIMSVKAVVDEKIVKAKYSAGDYKGGWEELMAQVMFGMYDDCAKKIAAAFKEQLGLSIDDVGAGSNMGDVQRFIAAVIKKYCESLRGEYPVVGGDTLTARAITDAVNAAYNAGRGEVDTLRASIKTRLRALTDSTFTNDWFSDSRIGVKVSAGRGIMFAEELGAKIRSEGGYWEIGEGKTDDLQDRIQKLMKFEP